jgi:hypothetical protein
MLYVDCIAKSIGLICCINTLPFFSSQYWVILNTDSSSNKEDPLNPPHCFQKSIDMIFKINRRYHLLHLPNLLWDCVAIILLLLSTEKCQITCTSRFLGHA